MIVFNGHVVLKLNPIGDVLAICAALSFVSYSLLVRKISTELPLILVARKTVFYSLVSLVPLLFTPLIEWKPDVLAKPVVVAHLLFLGVLASSFCLVLWNRVIWSLGAVKANNMIYLSPPVTMLAAALFLHEHITVFAVVGAVLILFGVYVSQRSPMSEAV
ncbi:MAG: DMT family transporter [Synergistaceae bacterium]